MQRSLLHALILAGLVALGQARGTAAPAADAPPDRPPDPYSELDSQFSDGPTEGGRSEDALAKHLLTAVHYVRKTTGGDVQETGQAWINELGQLLKVSVERAGPGNSERTDYFYDAGRVSLVETHYIRPPKDGGSGVRRENLIYRKGGVQIFNTSMSLPGPQSGGGRGAVLPAIQPLTPAEVQDQAFKIVQKLMSAGPPEYDPVAGPDARKYRLIMDSVSPDGHYALAFGLAQERTPWDDYHARNGGYVIPVATDAQKALVRNYVVDLKSHKIVGETGCHYARTRSGGDDGEEAGPECYTVWSADSDSFVQAVAENTGGQETEACRLGRIVDKRLLPTVDLLSPAQELARKTTHQTSKGKGNAGFQVELGEYNNQLSIDGDKVTVELEGGSGSRLVLEHFTMQMSHGVLSLGGHPTAEAVEPMMGATPKFAEPPPDSDQDQQTEMIRQMLEEERRKILTEQQSEPAPAR